MNFKLKKVKFFDEMSEETPCFTAEIWEDGKHVADVKNDGHGGCNDIHVYSKENRAQIYDKYMKLEVEIMELADEIDRVRQLQTKNFVLKKDGKLYTRKFPLPISKLKKHKEFSSWKERNFQSMMKEGYEILNKNL